MNPMKKFLAILLGATVVLGATIAFADDSVTDDDSDEVSVEQVDDAGEIEGVEEDGVADAASLEAPGQQVERGEAWDGTYARGLEVASIAQGGSMPQGLSDRYTAATTGITTTVTHGKSAEHGPSDSEG